MSSDLNLVTARLKGMTIVEDISVEAGFAALRVTVSGISNVRYATSGQEWNEWIKNTKRNHKRGLCFFADYDKHL